MSPLRRVHSDKLTQYEQGQVQNSRAGNLLALVQQMGSMAFRGRRVALLVVLCIVLATAGAQPGPSLTDMASQRACNSYFSNPACRILAVVRQKESMARGGSRSLLMAALCVLLATAGAQPGPRGPGDGGPGGGGPGGGGPGGGGPGKNFASCITRCLG